MTQQNDGGEQPGRTNLNFQQLYRLATWISTNAERLHKEQPGRREAARQAEAELGFRVTEHNVKAAQEATGIRWNPAREPGDASAAAKTLAAVKEEQAALWQRLAAADAQIATLRGLVHRLYEELSVAAPPGYTLPPPAVAPRLVTPNGK